MSKKNKSIDAMIRVSKETRSSLKVKAAQKGVTIKEYLKQLSSK